MHPRPPHPARFDLAVWLTLAAALLVAGALLTTGCTKREPAPEPVRLRAWIGSSGRSMLPTIPERALVEIEIGYPYAQLSVGRVAVFRDPASPAGLTLHTLVAQQAGAWIARGDANTTADRVWVTPENYVGVWTGRQTALLAAP